MRVVFVPLYFAALLFFSCLASNDPEDTAGGEDFPNSIGILVAENIDDHASWTNIDSITKSSSFSVPTTITSKTKLQKKTAQTSSTQIIPPSVHPLAKISAKSDTVAHVSGDTITITVTTPKLLSIRKDTLIKLKLADDDTVDLMSAGWEIHKKNGIVIHHYLSEDNDGDGIVTARPGQTNRIKIFNDTLKGLIREVSEIIMDAGKDEHFGDDNKNNDKEKDNLIVQFTTLQLSAKGDTINFSYWQDADGDGIITPNPNRDKNTVLMIEEKALPLGLKEQKRIVVDAGKDNHFGDDDKNKDKEKDNLIIQFTTLQLSAKGDTINFSYWQDADGDGIITPNPKRDSNTVLMFEYKQILGLREYNRIVIDAGKDKHFGDDDNKDKEKDNLIISANSAIVTAKNDTLKTTQILPNKAFAYGGSSADSVIVNFKEVIFLKNVARVQSEAVMVVWLADSTKNYPLTWREEKHWDNGRIEFTYIKGDNPDGFIRLGDTVIVAKEIYPPPARAVSSRTATFKADLGKDIHSESDDVFYGFTATENRRSGFIRLINFSLIPDEPLEKDEKLKKGDVKATFVSDSGKAWIIEGRFDEDKITVTFSSGEDKGEVVLDLDGNKIE